MVFARRVNMPKTVVVKNWNEYFAEFSARNLGRPARIEIFGFQGALLEARTFTLSGVSVVNRGAEASFVEIYFGEPSINATGKPLLRVPYVNSIKARATCDKSEPTVLFETADGSKTLLSFENPESHLNAP
jgi:hypothetical protein